MPNTQRFYRLRVRDSADTTDALVISSVPGGANPYLVKPFTGDGRSFDPLTGEVKTGAYTVEVIDALTGANTRVVTAELADANARQQLLSRKAFGETSTDGAAWTGLFGGYVNALRLVSPLKYAFAIGETRRISANRDVFKSTALTTDFSGKPLTFSQFDKTTCIFGGPIRGGWLGVRDLGGWRFRVNGTSSVPKYVQLKLLRAFDPRKPENGTFSTLSSAIVDSMCGVAAPYYRESPTWKNAPGGAIRGYFPGILYRIQTVTGTFVGNFTPLSEPVHPDKATPPNIFTRTGEASIWVAWTGTLPTVGDQYDVYMYPTDISEDNPLHIFEHPVDLRQKLWDESGIAYDSSVLAAVRSAIGDEIRLALRITKSPGKLKDLEATLNGLFGMATRSDGQAREVLFAHRIKLSSSPGSTIAVNDLRDAGGTVFELDESTVVSKVTIKQKRLTQRIAGSDAPTADSIVTVDQSVTVNNSDADITAYGDKEIVYEIEGQILTDKAQQDFDLEKYTLGVAREIFDRYGRGAIGGELHCLPSVTVDVGQEVLVNIPQLPNAVIGATPVSQRGGNRIVQVIRRTETPSGPDLYVLDSGTTAQPGTLPTFTIAASANDGFHFADLVITNAATLAAAGYQVRIEIAVGSSTPSTGTLLSVVDPAVVTSFTIPAHDAGTKVWARMRSEKAGYRPSAWTSFAGVQLTTLNAVTGLAVSAQDAADISKRTLTWTTGANAAEYPVEVLLRLTADSASADRLVAILPPGSTQYVLTELDVENRTATVRHRERAPFNGFSADATVTVNTTGTPYTLNPPTNPVGFSGPLGSIPGIPYRLTKTLGQFGIDVIATEFPSSVEVYMAVGAGAYASAGIVESLQDVRTRWSLLAPNDGLARKLKARHVRVGSTPSAFTAEVIIADPWSQTATMYPGIPGATAVPPVAFITPLNGDTDDLTWNERFSAVAGSGGGGTNLTWAIYQKIGFAAETTLFSGNATTLPKDAAITRHPRSDKDLRFETIDTATGLKDVAHLTVPAARPEINDTGNPFRNRPFDDGGYSGHAVDPGGDQLDGSVTQQSGGTARNLAVGRYTVLTGTHAQSVSFPSNYQYPPAVNILGGISYQPAALWGTAVDADTLPTQAGTSAPTSTAQIDEVIAYNVTVSGCVLRARLRQSSPSAPQSDTYASGAITTDGGTKEVTTASAPASGDAYTSAYTYDFEIAGVPGKVGSISATVCLDYWGGSGWIQVASATYADTDSDGDGSVIISGSGSLAAIVSGLTSSSRFRIRLVVNGTSGSGSRTYSVIPSACTYVTTSGDHYTSKTPAGSGIYLSVEVIGAS